MEAGARWRKKADSGRKRKGKRFSGTKTCLLFALVSRGESIFTRLPACARRGRAEDALAVGMAVGMEVRGNSREERAGGNWLAVGS